MPPLSLRLRRMHKTKYFWKIISWANSFAIEMCSRLSFKNLLHSKLDFQTSHVDLYEGLSKLMADEDYLLDSVLYLSKLAFSRQIHERKKETWNPYPQGRTVTIAVAHTEKNNFDFLLIFIFFLCFCFTFGTFWLILKQKLIWKFRSLQNTQEALIWMMTAANTYCMGTKVVVSQNIRYDEMLCWAIRYPSCTFLWKAFVLLQCSPWSTTHCEFECKLESKKPECS